MITEIISALHPILTEEDLELFQRILNNESIQLGLNHGQPRLGHPEGQVVKHVQEILQSIFHRYSKDPDFFPLVLLTILHDSFKYNVNKDKPQVGSNHHGTLAANFAKELQLTRELTLILELHDEAYKYWKKAYDEKSSESAQDERIAKLYTKMLIKDLQAQGALEIFVKFYKLDSSTGDKNPKPFRWFMEILEEITKET